MCVCESEGEVQIRLRKDSSGTTTVVFLFQSTRSLRSDPNVGLEVFRLSRDLLFLNWHYRFQKNVHVYVHKTLCLFGKVDERDRVIVVE